MNMSDSFIRAWEITKEYDLDDIPEEFKNGNCYQCAANHVMGNSKTHTLAHTMVSGQGALRGRRYYTIILKQEMKWYTIPIPS